MDETFTSEPSISPVRRIFLQVDFDQMLWRMKKLSFKQVNTLSGL